MSTKSDFITSPIGEILFLALNNKVPKTDKKGSPEGYTVRLKFTDTTKEGAAFKKTIAAINKDLIGPKDKSGLKPGEYIVRAFTQFAPVVLDGEGNPMEELPNFYADSTGTASMVVTAFDTENGGGINLAGVKIYTIEVGDHPGTTEEARAETANRIRALLAGG